MLRPLSLAEIGKLSTIAEPVGTASLLLLSKPEEFRVRSRAVGSCSGGPGFGTADYGRPAPSICVALGFGLFMDFWALAIFRPGDVA